MPAELPRVHVPGVQTSSTTDPVFLTYLGDVRL